MKKRQILARRVFVEAGPAFMARDLWQRDGLTLGVRPKRVKAYRRVVSCDGIRHEVWFVVAYGALLDVAPNVAT